MNLIEILQSIKHNPHYLNRYVKFIEYCRKINLESKLTKQNCYMESHHICPASKVMFPQYNSLNRFPWNKIDLTSRQHFIAHWLLWKSYNNSSTAKAFYYMKKQSSPNHKRYFRITSRVFEALKETHRDFKHTEETKVKISNTLKEMYSSGQLSISEKNKNSCREFQKNRIWTQESKNKLSQTKKNKGSSKGSNNSQYGKKFKWMNKDKINKKVPLIEVENFLLLDWRFGRIS